MGRGVGVQVLPRVGDASGSPGDTVPSGQRRRIPPLASFSTTIHALQLVKWGKIFSLKVTCTACWPLPCWLRSPRSGPPLGIVGVYTPRELLGESSVAGHNEERDRYGDGEEDEGFHRSGWKHDVLARGWRLGDGTGRNLADRFIEDCAQEAQVGELFGGLCPVGVIVREGGQALHRELARGIVFHLCSCCG